MCGNEKSCITINCGCCEGNTPVLTPSGMKYAQLEADRCEVEIGTKVYFKSQSVGNLEITEKGSVIVPAGTYHFFCNFQIFYFEYPCIVELMLYDLIHEIGLGRSCQRTNTGIFSSGSDSPCIVKLEQDTELCLYCTYISKGKETKNPVTQTIHATIIQLPV